MKSRYLVLGLVLGAAVLFTGVALAQMRGSSEMHGQMSGSSDMHSRMQAMMHGGGMQGGGHGMMHGGGADTAPTSVVARTLMAQARRRKVTRGLPASPFRA